MNEFFMFGLKLEELFFGLEDLFFLNDFGFIYCLFQQGITLAFQCLIQDSTGNEPTDN